MKIRSAVSVCMVIASMSAFGAPEPADVAAYIDAGQKLTALLDEASHNGKIEALRSNDRLTRLIVTISDQKRMLSGPAPTAKDLSQIMQICDVANKASIGLLLFDLKAHINPKASAQESAAAMVPLMTANNIQFQNELKKVQPFLFKCLAREIPAITEFTLALKPEEFTQVRRDALVTMRRSFLQIYSGGLKATVDTRFREDYRVEMLAALAGLAAPIVSIMPVADRKPIADAVQVETERAGKVYRPHLANIATAFRSVACEGLCQVQ